MLLSIITYELKPFLRSTHFRIMLLLSLSFTLLGCGIFHKSWWLFSFISTAPYFILQYFTPVLCVYILFTAPLSIISEKKLTSIDSLYTRSFSNAQYILGKWLALFFAYLMLSLAVLVLTLIVNIVLLPEQPDFTAYGLYFLIFPLPAVIVMLSLSFVIAMVFKVESIVYTVLIGFFLVSLLYISPISYNLFDITASRLPLIASEITGLTNIVEVGWQRLVFICAGCGLAVLAIFMFNRLPQQRFQRITSIILAVIVCVVTVLTGNQYLEIMSAGKTMREDMRDAENRNQDIPRLTVSSCRLDVVHDSGRIIVTADMAVSNNTPEKIGTYIFSLNPGLEITDVSSSGEHLKHTRDIHICKITPTASLNPGAVDSITITCEGTVLDDASYLDIGEYDHTRHNAISHFTLEKRHGFVTSEFVLLTHETMWYPSTTLKNPGGLRLAQEKQFIDFALSVRTDSSLTALSQGASSYEDGIWSFTPEVPLPQISLVIGKYDHKAVTANGIDISLYTTPGHETFSQHYTELSRDDLSTIIQELFDEFEVNLGLEYPYPRLSLVEVPIQFLAYQRALSLAPDTVQPEQLLIPEKATFIERGNHGVFIENYMSHVNKTRKESEWDILQNFFKETFFNRSIKRTTLREWRNDSDIGWKLKYGNVFPPYEYNYNIFPNYFNFVNNISSEKYPVFPLSIGHYLKSKLKRNEFHYFTGYFIPESELAMQLLNENSLQDILDDPQFENVPYEHDLRYEVIAQKSLSLFKLMKAQTGREREIEDELYSLVKSHRFKTMTLDDFADEFQKRFDFDFSASLTPWMTSSLLPKFVIHDRIRTTVDTGRKRYYHMRAIVQNRGEVGGSIHLLLTGLDIDKDVYLEPGQVKDVGFRSRSASKWLSITTSLAENLPHWALKWNKREISRPESLFVGERVLDSTDYMHDDIILLDDLDNEFSTHDNRTFNPVQTFFRNVRKKPQKKTYGYAPFKPQKPPATWVTSYDPLSFWGKKSRTIHYVKAGKGDQTAEFDFTVDVPGRYSLAFLAVRKGVFRKIDPFSSRDLAIDDFQFFIHHDGGVEEKILDMKKYTIGWAELGTYHFTPGEGKVVLTNKSKGKLVYVDAIKIERQ